MPSFCIASFDFFIILTTSSFKENISEKDELSIESINDSKVFLVWPAFCRSLPASENSDIKTFAKSSVVNSYFFKVLPKSSATAFDTASSPPSVASLITRATPSVILSSSNTCVPSFKVLGKVFNPPPIANKSTVAAVTLSSLSGSTATLSGTSTPFWSAIPFFTSPPAATFSSFNALYLVLILFASTDLVLIVSAAASLALTALASTAFLDVSNKSVVPVNLVIPRPVYLLTKYKGTPAPNPERAPAITVWLKSISSFSSTLTNAFCADMSWAIPPKTSTPIVDLIALFAIGIINALPTPSLAICWAATPASLPPPGSNKPARVEGAVIIPPI